MRKFKVISGWIIVIAALVTSLSFVNKKRGDIPCRQVKVIILDSLYNGFITKKDILQVVHKKYKKILGSPISGINTKKLENSILKSRAISRCDIFTTADGIIFIEVLQRQPVLRIINAKNMSYYIDKEGYIIPFSSIQTPNVLVATGNIKENFKLNPEKHDHIKCFDTKRSNNILRDLYNFSCFVYNDPFWRSQFVQIYVNKKEELELIPRVGAHIIILGKSEDFENKLLKLKTLYLKGLNKNGWNQYEIINLKYKNQVICSKR